MDPLSRASVRLKPMLQRRNFAAVCAISNYILVFGGKDEKTEKVLVSCEKYDVSTRRQAYKYTYLILLLWLQVGVIA